MKHFLLTLLMLLAFISMATYSFFMFGGIESTSAFIKPVEPPLRVSDEDYWLAKLGAYKDGLITTKGPLPVRVSSDVMQANAYSIDGNYNNLQGSIN